MISTLLNCQLLLDSFKMATLLLQLEAPLLDKKTNNLNPHLLHLLIALIHFQFVFTSLYLF